MCGSRQWRSPGNQVVSAWRGRAWQSEDCKSCRSWPVLQADKWGGNSITTISYNTMEDTFMFWYHRTKLVGFFYHLHCVNVCSYISFWRWRDGHLPFSDIDIYKRLDGSQCKRVYQKPMDTSTLTTPHTTTHATKRSAGPQLWLTSLQDELEVLKVTFRETGYKQTQSHQAIHSLERAV